MNYDTYIKQHLRRAFFRSRLRNEALRQGKIAPNQYKCSSCQNVFPSSFTKIDHISPVVDPAVGFVSWDVYIARLFCDVSNLTTLCRDCHNAKTRVENNLRKIYGTGPYSKASREKNSKANIGHDRLKGIKKTEEHKKAMSLSRKGKPQTEARQAAVLKSAKARQKPVKAINLSTQEVLYFESVKEASISLSVNGANISRVCNGKRKQESGYHFEYVTELLDTKRKKE